MRTAELKLNGSQVTGVLLAGGPGFKIYHVITVDGFVLNVDQKLHTVLTASPEYAVVARYVNIRYMPSKEHFGIKTRFNDLLKTYRTEPANE
jgi:hypothetical protein